MASPPLAQALTLQQLEVAHFKNQHGHYTFAPRLTCITGLNGIGKTNLLDAIYLLALTKSRFQKSDPDLIAYGQDYYRVAGTFAVADDALQVSLAYRRGERKILKDNGLVAERLADHIGKLPVVFVNPDDTPLVRGGAEERRKFFDNLLSQSSAPYLAALLKQNRLLQQRNALLASLAERRSTDMTLLDTYDEPLVAAFYTLAQERAACLAAFMPAFAGYYAQLSQGREVPQIEYQTQVLEADFEHHYYLSRNRDLAAGRTLMGAHRDEFELLMDGQPVRKVGSQGQQKTFLLALKLAMHDFLATRTQRMPLLLLDDIFERLDETRIAGLLGLIAQGRLGQAFVTEATGERMRRVVAQAGLADDAGWIALG